MPAGASDQRTEELVASVQDLLGAYLASAGDRELPVVRPEAPESLREAFRRAGVSIELDDPQAATSAGALEQAVRDTLALSVRTHHPLFLNQNFAGADPVAVLADWVGAALNTTAATGAAAPVFTLMERAVAERFASLAGLAGAEGVLNPGGAMSNLTALHLARHRAMPGALEHGLAGGPRLAAFTSEHGHFSLERAAVVMGLGRGALVKVACDGAGRMRPEALDEAVRRSRARGELPFFLNATAGSTIVGAFDPLPELAAVAREHGIWLHVDGCHGASVLFSARHRHLMRGVETADSLVWDAHKMLGVTQQCSLLLVRHPGMLRECFAAGAAYLFGDHGDAARPEPGELTFLCGRRVDSLKLWLTWKARGDEGFARRIDHAMELAAHAAARVRDDPGRRFELAFPPAFTHVCFWWVPPDLRPLGDWGAPPVRERLQRVSRAISVRMRQEGKVMMACQSVAGRPDFFRLPFINPEVTREDVDTVLDLTDRYGTEVAGGAAVTGAGRASP